MKKSNRGIIVAIDRCFVSVTSADSIQTRKDDGNAICLKHPGFKARTVGEKPNKQPQANSI